MNDVPMTPVLPREEYVEQAYFWRVFRERIQDGQPSQEILEFLKRELLSTTKLPLAVEFMLDELKHSGLLGAAIAAVPHYFTPFQCHVISQAEDPASRFTFTQALLILEREAHYRAEKPTLPGLFFYHVETVSRNRLGYRAGLESMMRDAFYEPAWREYLRMVRVQLGTRDLAELVFARSQHFLDERRRQNPAYEASFEPLFGEKEGKIAAASIGHEPSYFFSALQRQLGYPSVPRLPRADAVGDPIKELAKKLKLLEQKFSILEQELKGSVDLTPFLAKPDDLEGSA
ncbi:hypothetical protein Pan216_07110 [Planctomycetes bacterium Pan216]|uniref:Uncharacterized protein n=1 Tax=Kolteria novifilia TaxID=2527975 RepID=A0A518AYS6_9BACT|nr:hypothetical protein Pan216_07110 [Planctomycetes bacterium Pan216]